MQSNDNTKSTKMPEKPVRHEFVDPIDGECLFEIRAIPSKASWFGSLAVQSWLKKHNLPVGADVDTLPESVRAWAHGGEKA